MNSPHVTKFHFTSTGAYPSAGGYARYMQLTRDGEREREDLRYQETQNLPAWAADNPQRFFEAADQQEGVKRRIAEGWVLSLPRGLDREQQVALTQDFVTGVNGAQHPHTWVIHETVAHDGDLNPHVHLLMSGRIMDGIERSPAQFFALYNSRDPASGGAEKSDYFTQQMGHVKDQRVLWADLSNWHCESAGVAQRYDPRAFTERGIEREQETRLWPHKYDKQREEIAQAREARQITQPEEARLAAEYWEARKVALGITEGMTMAQGIAAIRQGTPQPDAPPQDSIEQLAQRVHTLRQEVAQVHAEVMQETHREKVGAVQTPDAAARVNRLLDDEAHLKRGMQPTLHEEEAITEGWSHGRRY